MDLRLTVWFYAMADRPEGRAPPLCDAAYYGRLEHGGVAHSTHHRKRALMVQDPKRLAVYSTWSSGESETALGTLDFLLRTDPPEVDKFVGMLAELVRQGRHLSERGPL